VANAVRSEAALPGLPTATNTSAALYAVGITSADLPAGAARAPKSWLYSPRRQVEAAGQVIGPTRLVKRGFSIETRHIHFITSSFDRAKTSSLDGLAVVELKAGWGDHHHTQSYNYGNNTPHHL
jgi:hypothetical protein